MGESTKKNGTQGDAREKADAGIKTTGSSKGRRKSWGEGELGSERRHRDVIGGINTDGRTNRHGPLGLEEEVRDQEAEQAQPGHDLNGHA